jgi:RimJ/RimL family protein N-acetyltransferase
MNANPLIELVPIQVSDVDSIMEWINDPEVTKNFALSESHITREQETTFIAGVVAEMQKPRPSDFMFAVHLDGVLIGTAGIHKIYWPAGNARLGIMLGRHRGEGLGEIVLKSLIKHAFLIMNLHKVWMIHFETNARVRHLAEKMGFVCEGVLRDEYYHNGEYHNMVRHSLLNHEFISRSK